MERNEKIDGFNNKSNNQALNIKQIKVASKRQRFPGLYAINQNNSNSNNQASTTPKRAKLRPHLQLQRHIHLLLKAMVMSIAQSVKTSSTYFTTTPVTIKQFPTKITSKKLT